MMLILLATSARRGFLRYKIFLASADPHTSDARFQDPSRCESAWQYQLTLPTSTKLSIALTNLEAEADSRTKL